MPDAISPAAITMSGTGLTGPAVLRPLTAASTIMLLGSLGKSGECQTSTRFRRQTIKQTNEQINEKTNRRISPSRKAPTPLCGGGLIIVPCRATFAKIIHIRMLRLRRRR